MGQISKIEQYQVEDRVLALRASGMSHEEIAATVTRELRAEKGIEDSIARAAVTRWLKKEDKVRAGVLGEIRADYIRKHAVTDLERLDAMKAYYYDLWEGKTEKIFYFGREFEVTLQIREAAGRMYHELVKTTLRFMGVGGGEGGEVSQEAAVDLSKYKTDMVEAEAASG